MRIFTIGVYGWDARSFLEALQFWDVSILLDVRQRRGVRGPDYPWANARRLQANLEWAGIAYRHVRELAPTTELRHLQYAADAEQRVGQRSRVALAEAYRQRYGREILDRAPLSAIVNALPGGAVPALFCLERDPEACHRSLIASRLSADWDMEVIDVRL